MIAQDAHRRTIRSYVRREGRITKAQQRALTELWSRYGIDDAPTVLDFSAVFDDQGPVILEIGFGDGDALLAAAAARPDSNFLGVEVHRPGVGSLLRKLDQAGVDNVRVMIADAEHVLAARIPDASLAAVWLFFADPWPKKRHHKRRLVQPGFVELVRVKLQPGGYFHLATDWREYAEHMLAVLSQARGLANAAGPRQYAPRPPSRPATKFERRGQKLGHDVWDLMFRRVA